MKLVAIGCLALLLTPAFAGPALAQPHGRPDLNDRADQACSPAVVREVRRQHPGPDKVQTLSSNFRQLSSSQIRVFGDGQAADRGGGWSRFTYDCTYDNRAGQAVEVAVRFPPGNAPGPRPPPRPPTGGPAPPPVGGPPPRPGAPTPIHFRPGAADATVGGTVRGHDSRLFTLRARGGQMANLRLRSPNRFLYFNLTAPSGAMIFNGTGSSIGDRFIGRLPQSGEYRIDVYLMRNEARRNTVAPFNLDVSLR